MGMRVFFLFLSLTLLSSTPLLAFQNEPDGFRGLKWGTSFESVKKQMTRYMSMPGPETIVYYQRKSDKLQMGSALLLRIYYGFWRNKLISVTLDIKYRNNFDGVREVCFAKFGVVKPRDILGDEYSWEGWDTGIYLRYNRIYELGSLFIASQRLYAEYEEMAQGKAREAAKKDW